MHVYSFINVTMPEFYKEINLSALDKNLCNHINEYLLLTKLAVLIFHKQTKQSENRLLRRSEASESGDEEQFKTEVCFLKVLPLDKRLLEMFYISLKTCWEKRAQTKYD